MLSNSLSFRRSLTNFEVGLTNVCTDGRHSTLFSTWLQTNDISIATCGLTAATNDLAIRVSCQDLWQ